MKAEFFEQTLRFLQDAFGTSRNIAVSFYSTSELEAALVQKRLDFFISDAGFYSYARQKYQVAELVSLHVPEAYAPGKSTGSVFVVLNNRADLQSIADLRKRTAVATDRRAFGGYLVALGELQRQGYDPEKFFKDTFFLGYPAEKVIKALRNEAADVAILTTCALEDFIAAGLGKETEFRVVGAKKDTGSMTCRYSTQLYPDWVFAATPQASASLKKTVASDLLMMPPYKGYQWSVSDHYSSVEDLYRSLRVGHYEYLRTFEVVSFVKRYWPLLVAAVIFFLAIIFYNRLLAVMVDRKTRQLKAAVEETKTATLEKKEVEEELALMRRVSLVGMLTCASTREVETALTMINQNVEEITQFLKNRDSVEFDVPIARGTEARTQLHRVYTIISSIDSIGTERDGADSRLRVEVAPLLVQSVDNFKRYRNFTEIEMGGTNSTDHIRVVPFQFELVVISLLKYAVDALIDTNQMSTIRIFQFRQNRDCCIQFVFAGKLRDEMDYKDLYSVKNYTTDNQYGLGLMVCARLTENAGGSLTIEQLEDGTVRIQLLLPLDEVRPGEEGEGDAEQPRWLT
jgi:two-component system sensor histidine kinase TtrS